MGPITVIKTSTVLNYAENYLYRFGLGSAN